MRTDLQSEEEEEEETEEEEKEVDEEEEEEDFITSTKRGQPRVSCTALPCARPSTPCTWPPHW